MPKEIRVTVNPDGTTQTDFTGFSGKACLHEADELRKLLAERFGVKITEQKSLVLKPEINAVETIQQTTRQKEQA